MLKAPFPWFGGKSRAASLVWSRLGNVGNYIEPFAGSLAILLARPHEPRIETANDRDVYLANFWRATQKDPLKVARYADWPVNEADLQARHHWLSRRQAFREKMLTDPHYCDAKIAGWWVWGISQWIGSGWCARPEWTHRGQGGRAPRGLHRIKRPMLNHSGRGVVQAQMPRLSESNGVHRRPHLSSNGTMGIHSITNDIREWLEALADRLRRVRVCCHDWRRVLTPSCTWKLGGGTITGVLLDPPYSHKLRDRRLYSHDEESLSEDVRRWAIENGNNPQLRIALCGLDTEHTLPPGWTAAQWDAPRGYSNKGPRAETIWFSPHCLQPISLYSENELIEIK
jgi:DNA adenine methylase